MLNVFVLFCCGLKYGFLVNFVLLESNMFVKDLKVIIFCKFIFGDCFKWNWCLCFGIFGMCIWL